MSAQDICQHAGCGHLRREHDDGGAGCLHGYWLADGCACEGFMGPPVMGLDVASAGDAEGVAALAGCDAPAGCDGGHPGCSVCDAAEAGEPRPTDAELAEVLRSGDALRAMAGRAPLMRDPERAQMVAEFQALVLPLAPRMARELIALRAGYAEHERKFEAGAGWFREMADRPMPCGHTIGDLIGGDGSVTACGACLAEKRPGVIKALRAEVERLRAVEAVKVADVDRVLTKHAEAVGVVGPMPGQKASER